MSSPLSSPSISSPEKPFLSCCFGVAENLTGIYGHARAATAKAVVRSPIGTIAEKVHGFVCSHSTVVFIAGQGVTAFLSPTTYAVGFGFGVLNQIAYRFGVSDLTFTPLPDDSAKLEWTALAAFSTAMRWTACGGFLQGFAASDFFRVVL